MSLNSGRKTYQIAALERAIERYGPLTSYQIVELARFKSGRSVNLSSKSARIMLERAPQFVIYDSLTLGREVIPRYILKSQ